MHHIRQERQTKDRVVGDGHRRLTIQSELAAFAQHQQIANVIDFGTSETTPTIKLSQPGTA